jgi:hypothetical protein
MMRVHHGPLISNERQAEKFVDNIGDKVIFKFDYKFIHSKGFMYKEKNKENT